MRKWVPATSEGGRQPRDNGGVVQMLITDSGTSVMQGSDSERFLFRTVFLEPAIGCGRDRETGALLSPPRNAFDLISAPQHNYWHADCSAPVGRITVAVLGWGRTAFTQLFESKLVNIRMNQSAWQIWSALTKLCVSSFFLCFSLWYQRRICNLSLMTVIQMNLIWEMKAKQGPSFYGD